MAKPSEVPEIFCTDTNYSTLSQRPGRNGTPTKVDGGAAWRNEGAKPAEGADGQWFNYDANIWSKYVRWVYEGSNTPDADAHIVETDFTGMAKIRTAQFGVSGVTPNALHVASFRGAIAPAQDGAWFQFTGDSTEKAGVDIQASGRTALSVFTSEEAANHGYGRYPSQIVRTGGHGVISHRWNALPVDVKSAIGSEYAYFTGYSASGDNAYCFLGAGDGRLAKLHRRSGSGAILELRTEDNTQTRGLAIYSTNAPAIDGSTIGQSATIYVDTSGNSQDSGPRPTAYLGGRMQDGLISVTTEPERASWSGAAAGVTGYVKANSGQTKLANGSAGVFAIRGAGGCGFRAVIQAPGSSQPEFDVPPLQSGYDVRILDEGAQHLSMSYTSDGDVYGFNVGDRFGLTAQKAPGDTRLLRARRGSGGEGYSAESMVTYRGYPIHWVRALKLPLPLQDTVTSLITLNSQTANGPTPPMVVGEGSYLIKYWANGVVKNNETHQITLEVVHNTSTTVIRSLPIGTYQTSGTAHFQVAGGVIQEFTNGSGHQSWSLRISLAGITQVASGDVLDCGLEVIALS